MATDNDPAIRGTPTHFRILCLTGPESTGKTTLARTMAERLGARLVPEVARDYLQHRPRYTAADLSEIARHQVAEERLALAETTGLVVCDTDISVIWIWWQEKFGVPPESLEQLMAQRSERAYLLMKPDLTWEPDLLRENPDDRDRLFDRYDALLSAGGHPYRVVSGRGEERLANALGAARSLFSEPSTG